eukprot:15016767-Ditylum_brightwellii.AAC.1
MKWSESFHDLPLAYVVQQESVIDPNAAPAIAAGQPYSAERGSVEDDLIARATHNQPLYQQDNASVYYKLEEATHATNYAESIKPFQRTKNGREAFKANINQYAKVDK